ncbi:MAG: hypothetical protein JST06_00605 [Bacteroidetes bacterium]|nr:hypothetical protein [Bacteroidota bacterium]MBS1630029.1 hypothetical protein [Bacteroidota bacterium]
MKLYRKKLDSLDALKREQLRLRYESKKADWSDLLPTPDLQTLGSLFHLKKGWLGTFMEVLSAKSEVQLLIALAMPLLKAWNQKRTKLRDKRAASGLPPKPSFFKKALRELFIGYIVGKAVMKGFSGLRSWQNRRKKQHSN